jgi:iron complex transport system ATP-binding protein
VDGKDVRAWGRRELARLVGVVPQSEAVAFPITVREMVAMGRYPHLGALRAEGLPDKQAIARALERCDVAELEARPVTALSGGELQRVRIARALAQEPRVLTLDEPTASLDVSHEMTIIGLLRAWARDGMTVLLITHQLELAARFADRIVLLDRGRVAAEGAPEEVFLEEVLERVYQWPLQVGRDPITGAPRAVALEAPPAGLPPNGLPAEGSRSR